MVSYSISSSILSLSQAGVDITALAKRPVGDALDMDEIFREWKEVLTDGKLDPSKALMTSRMISACFRKGPRTWMEALGALQVLGFDPDRYVVPPDVFVHLR